MVGEFTELCEKNGVRHEHSRVYWPQGNGLMEHFIQTMKRGLAVMIAQHGGEWEEHLHCVLRGYRCSRQASTYMFPFFIMIGRHPRLAIENVLDMEEQVQPTTQPANTDMAAGMMQAITIFQADQQVLTNIE